MLLDGLPCHHVLKRPACMTAAVRNASEQLDRAIQTLNDHTSLPTYLDELDKIINTIRNITDQERLIFLDLVLGIIFFVQTGAGVLGNVFLLCHCTFTFLMGRRLKPIEMIFSHLVLANSIVLISKGFPQTMASLGMKMFLNQAGCRLTAFLHRVARSLSISITCLLSGFQVITISSFNCSQWSKLIAPKYIFSFCHFFWILHILINITMFMNNLMKGSNNTKIWNIGFCSDVSSATFKVSLFVIIYAIYDFLCMVFMVMTSGYLILFLQRHHHQVQHIHSSRLLSRTSAEIRASYSILVLVSTYVIFYSVNSILSLYHIQFDKYYHWLMPTSTLLVACYPTMSPFVLISSDSQILHLFYSLWHKK
ncbi:vomeronasal type-1 receptor 3-like [Macrotis lagotis]|uniref:vomeronasal type-1 receptor 3-like n=1 Tax=Macrotis lagotis TaxID=92651 RepID=UPI003D693290